MPRKKIVFVIVEGPSDEEAVGVLLSRIYDASSVYVHVVHGDITTELDAEPDNIVKKISDIIRRYAGKTFRQRDFSRIVHITDTDGVFIPDEMVISDQSRRRPFYLPTGIWTRNKAGIEERNRRKRANLNRLSETQSVWGVPYRIYYMSCNLDHALYGKLNSTDDDKENDSFDFAERYKDDIPAFMKFISESDFSVMNGYAGSWEYIRGELHSLERHTNFGLCFNENEPEEAQKWQ